MKRTKIVEAFIPSMRFELISPVFKNWKFYHLNYIGKPRLVPALIRRRLPFIVLPTNYFLKNIDDNGQITTLRQEKNQESFY